MQYVDTAKHINIAALDHDSDAYNDPHLPSHQCIQNLHYECLNAMRIMSIFCTHCFQSSLKLINYWIKFSELNSLVVTLSLYHNTELDKPYLLLEG